MRISKSWQIVSVLSLVCLVTGVITMSMSAPTEGAGSVATGGACEGCGDLIVIPGGPPEVVAQKLEEAKVKIRAKIQPRLDKLRNEAATRFNNWYGTQAVVADSVAKEDRALCDTIAGYLTGDTAVPEERAVEFARFLNQGSIRCIRWDVIVLSAKSDGDSWEATVRVQPWLAKISGRPVYTPHATLETWRVDRDGRATPLKVAVDESRPRGLILED